MTSESTIYQDPEFSNYIAAEPSTGYRFEDDNVDPPSLHSHHSSYDSQPFFWPRDSYSSLALSPYEYYLSPEQQRHSSTASSSIFQNLDATAFEPPRQITRTTSRVVQTPSELPSDDDSLAVPSSSRRSTSRGTPDRSEASAARQRAHYRVEQKYRKGLNDKITALGKMLEPVTLDDDGQVAQNPGKGAILSRAIEHIEELKAACEHKDGEIAALKEYIVAIRRTVWIQP